MAALVIHASKDAESTRALFIDPALTISKAQSLGKKGWQVHVTDADGHIYYPDRFDELLRFAQKKTPR
jgi:hypothetical protein